MKTITSLAVFFSLSLVCWKTPGRVQRDQKSIVHIKYVTNLDLLNVDSTDITTMADSVLMSFGNARIVVRIPVGQMEITARKTDSGMILTETGKVLGIMYEYVLFDSVTKSSAYYKTGPAGLHTAEANVDAILKKKINILPNFIDPLVDSLVFAEENDVVREERYVTKFKPDESYPDSTIVLFGKHLQHVPFSICPSLDSLRKMKVTSVRFVTNEIKARGGKPKIPKRELSLRMEEVRVNDDTVLTKLLYDRLKM